MPCNLTNIGIHSFFTLCSLLLALRYHHGDLACSMPTASSCLLIGCAVHQVTSTNSSLGTGSMVTMHACVGACPKLSVLMLTVF